MKYVIRRRCDNLCVGCRCNWTVKEDVLYFATAEEAQSFRSLYMLGDDTYVDDGGTTMTDKDFNFLCKVLAAHYRGSNQLRDLLLSDLSPAERGDYLYLLDTFIHQVEQSGLVDHPLGKSVRS